MTPAEADLTAAGRLVVKLGSALVARPEGGADADRLGDLAADIAVLRRAKVEVTIVCSGAVAIGRSLTGDAFRSGRLEDKQAAAAVGQSRLMQAWSDAFSPHGLMPAQALLTLADTEARRRWLNARNTLNRLLAAGVVPIINENDTVATEEIRYGDNDRLAARVAQMIGADRLVLLSDIDGLYTADPRSNPKADFLPRIDAITPEILAMAGGPNAAGQLGSGGMASKLAAAQIATAAGCAVAITSGAASRPLSRLAGGARASWFPPHVNPQTARKQWILGTLEPTGAIEVDAGAARALMQGASLLPVGVLAVDGGFDRGECVRIRADDGTDLARGLAAYDAGEARQLIGVRTEDIETRLGYRRGAALVHRDDLVLITRAYADADSA
ncbi:MAG: glutamate 5-kinase [Maricaulaceae bacterium]